MSATSSQPSSGPQQTGKAGRTRTRRTQQAGSQRGGNRQDYLHPVEDAKASLLTESKCQEIKQKTGADVEFDPNLSDLQNTKTVIIRGSRPQIEAAVRLINQETGAQGTISAQAQTFWQQWAELAFPNLDSRAYFLPPVYFNRVPRTKHSIAGQEVLVLHEAPGQAGQSTPGQTVQSTPGQAVQSTPGQAGQPTPGQADQSTPGQAGQSTAGPADQSTLGQAGQSTPGQADQSTPGQADQSTSGQADQSTPGQAGQSTSGQAVQSTPGQAGQSTPGQVGQSTPGQVGQSTPGQAVQSTPGQVGQPTPGQVGQSTPGQADQSAPGQVGQPTPGQADQSTPRQADQSTPGQVGLSTPGQAGQPNQPPVNLFSGNKVVQYSDVRDDAAMQRFLFCLQKMSEENSEVLVGLSQLQFGQYLGEPCYAAAAAHLPVADSLPAALSKNKRGDFDVMLIHRQYGIVVCEVKAFGDNVGELSMSQPDTDKNIRKKLKKAVSQLNKAENMLTHLVSDVTVGLRITKTIVVPNLTARQVQKAISGDIKLVQDLCACLGTTDPADITGLCLCSDQLSDPKTPWDVSSDVLRELGNWWQRRVTVSGPDSHMTCDNYKTLVARFCGPATTVTVPCTSPPRLCVKTLGQAVSWTGECYTAQISLFPEQLRLLNTAHPKVFVAGPPGTGKSVVLLLMATEWLRCGNDVHIVSIWFVSLPACIMLYHQLLQIVNTQLTSVVSPGQPHLMQCDIFIEKDVDKDVNVLSQAAKRGSLYVIADEIDVGLKEFQPFCDKLMAKVPRLHFWAASCYHRHAPPGWDLEYFSRPLRSPPIVVREVQQDKAMTERGEVQAYIERGVADHTDGPQVRRLNHGRDHPGGYPQDCVICIRDVASFLHSLRVLVNPTTVPNSNSSTPPPCLQWRDVFVLLSFDVSDQSFFVRELRQTGIPIQVMKDDDTEDVVMARSDVVWVAKGDRVHGLERKIVVCLDIHYMTARLHIMSRCSSQLVFATPDS